MIGFMYAGLDTLPETEISPVEIDADTYPWPSGAQGGETNNVDQVGAYTIRAYVLGRAGDEAGSKREARNAREWVLHLLRGDGGHKDPAHVQLLGVRMYWHLCKEYGHKKLAAEAAGVLSLYGERALSRLVEYRDNRWFEPRLLGRTLSNVTQWAFWHLEDNEPLPDYWDGGSCYEVLSMLRPDRLRLDIRNHASQGWFKTPSSPEVLVLRGRSNLEPSVKDPFWHYIPWQMFSVLPYGIIDSWPLLPAKLRSDALVVLKALKEYCRYVTQDFQFFGDGAPKELMPWDGEMVHVLGPVSESDARNSYSFRLWTGAGVKGNKVVAYAPTNLGLRPDFQDLLNGMVVHAD